MEQKNYKEMNVDEQLQYVVALNEFANILLPRLQQTPDWSSDDRKDFADGVVLLTAFSYAKDFCMQTLFYADFQRRLPRILYYVNRIKKDLATGVTLKDSNGDMMTLLPSVKIARRRGRPTKEEKALMDAERANEDAASIESAKRMEIAKLLGIDSHVVIENPTREKTDAEKVAEIEAKNAAESMKQVQELTKQPDLFSSVNSSLEQTEAADYRLPLQKVKPFLSAELATLVDSVKDKRASFASNAERAKLLAEQGAKAEDVATYAQAAHDLNEEIESIYEAVDRELAMVYGRLCGDTIYRQAFKEKYNVSDVDLEPLKKSLKVYYDKMPETFAQEVVQTIQSEHPDVIAAKEKEAANKEAAAKIIKYLSRKDKPATAKRLETMTARIEELKQLIGEEAAAVYQPYVDACKEAVEKKNDNDAKIEDGKTE